LGEGPFGGGVGGKAAVVDGKGGFVVWVDQVLVELTHHHTTEHTLLKRNKSIMLNSYGSEPQE
jgi:hypothetical protein